MTQRRKEEDKKGDGRGLHSGLQVGRHGENVLFRFWLPGFLCVLAPLRLCVFFFPVFSSLRPCAFAPSRFFLPRLFFSASLRLCAFAFFSSPSFLPRLRVRVTINDHDRSQASTYLVRLCPGSPFANSDHSDDRIAGLFPAHHALPR